MSFQGLILAYWAACPAPWWGVEHLHRWVAGAHLLHLGLHLLHLLHSSPAYNQAAMGVRLNIMAHYFLLLEKKLKLKRRLLEFFANMVAYPDPDKKVWVRI